MWLWLCYIYLDWPSRKFDWLLAKYTVLETIRLYACRLDTPLGIYNVFYVSLLWLAADDPLPSQRSNDYRPPAILIDNSEEYEVEEIL